MPSPSITQARAVLSSVLDGPSKDLNRSRTTTLLHQQIIPLLSAQFARIDGAVSAIHNPSEEFELSRASQSLIDDVHDFRHFFLDAERSLNDKVFKNAKNDGYGSTIKRYWANEIFKNDPFDVRAICDITDAAAHQEESAKILHAINSASADDGASQLLAELKVRLASPGKGMHSAVLSVIEQLSNAERYEMLAKVDLYIRSGRADHDLDPGNKNTKTLRAALQNFIIKSNNPDKSGYSAAVQKAQEELLTQFGRVFLDIPIKQDKTTGEPRVPDGSVTTLANVNRPVEMTAPSQRVDAAIWGTDGKTLFASVVSSDQRMSNMTQQGQQLAQYTDALYEYAARSGKALDMTVVVRAQNPDQPPKKGSDRESFYNQIGVDFNDFQDKKFLSHLDKLQILAVLTAYRNVSNRENTRFCMVGKKLDWDSKLYKGEQFAAQAMTTVSAILEKLSHPDLRLLAQSKDSHQINQVVSGLTQIINVLKNNPVLQASHAQLQLLGTTLQQKVEVASSSRNVATGPFENLANTLRLIQPPAPVVSSSTTMEI